ncbi:unnamed protein product [Meloidogyne enterolobii]|uniref:Uncharacterized protein n=1 Tax=Meloidogyne enterolobii TaxID=390850 RepID=A0ACB0ZTZ0_MELEN
MCRETFQWKNFLTQNFCKIKRCGVCILKGWCDSYFNTKAYYRHSFWKGVSRLDKRAKIGGGAKRTGKRERQGLERFLVDKNRFLIKKGRQ